MAVKISDLEGIHADRSKRSIIFLNSDEQALRASAARHLEVARLLYQEEFYREAFSALQGSVECFYKHVFCLVRCATWNGKTADVTSVPPFYRRIAREGDYSSKSFGHDVSALLRFLGENIDDLDRPAIQRITVSLRSTWAADRYSDPSLIDVPCRKAYRPLHEAFTSTLDGQFVRLK